MEAFDQKLISKWDHYLAHFWDQFWDHPKLQRQGGCFGAYRPCFSPLRPVSDLGQNPGSRDLDRNLGGKALIVSISYLESTGLAWLVCTRSARRIWTPSLRGPAPSNSPIGQLKLALLATLAINYKGAVTNKSLRSYKLII